MDLAMLGIGVESRELKQANDNLKDFQREAKGAERAADSFVGGARRAESATGKMHKEIAVAEKATGRLRIAMVAAGAAIGAALGAGILSAIERIRQMEVAQARLDRALANSGSMAGKSAADVQKWADSLERTTGRAASEVMAVGANLASFGFSEDVFFRAIELADDMAAAWGGDLKQNLEGLSRALDDPIKGFAMLRQRGISLSDAQADLVKQFMAVNDKAGAQGVVFEALEAQVKGVAEAGFFGLTKAMANARLAMEQFFEGLVTNSGLTTAFEYALYAVAYAFDALSTHLDTILKLASIVGSGLLVAFGPAILGAVATLTVAIGTGLVGAMTALTLAMARNPFLFIATAISVALVSIYQFRDEISQVIGVDIGAIFKSAANLVMNSFSAAFEYITSTVAMIPDAFHVAGEDAANAFLAAMNEMARGVITTFNGIISSIRGATRGTALEGLGSSLPMLDNKVPLHRVNLGGASASANLRVGRAHRDANIAGIMATDNFAGFGQAETSARSASAAISELNDNLAGAAGAGGAAAGGANKASDAWKGLRDAASATNQEVQKTLQAQEELGRGAGGILKGLIDGTLSWKDALLQAGQALLKYLDQTSMASGGGGLFGGGFLQGLVGSIFGFADGGVAAYGKPQPLKTFARGGVSNTAAIFGEAGPEAAVPLPDGRHIPVKIKSGGGGSGSTDVVRIVLQDDSGRMADIAQKEIRTAAGPIIQVSVEQSTKAVKSQMPGMLADAQTRKM